MLDGQDHQDTTPARTGLQATGTAAGSLERPRTTSTPTRDGRGSPGATADSVRLLRETARENLEDWLDLRDGDPLAEQHRWALLPPGKLLRPMLLLESAAAVGGSVRRVEPAATGFELMHAGSLIHDDIIDGDDLRRGREATHRRYGVDRAVISADALFFAVFATLEECRLRGVPDRLITEATAVIAEAGLQMTRGAALELDLSGALHDDTGLYLEVARLKTAALLRAACRTGAVLAGGTAEQAAALSEFGEALGVAFQIRDDLLPYRRPEEAAAAPGPAAREARTERPASTERSARPVRAARSISAPTSGGKPRGSDLRNRRPALPLLLARRYGVAADRALLAELLGGGTSGDGTPGGGTSGNRAPGGRASADAAEARQAQARQQVEEATRQESLRRLLERTGALKAAQETADAYVDRCRRALRLLPPGPHRGRLEALAVRCHSSVSAGEEGTGR